MSIWDDWRKDQERKQQARLPKPAPAAPKKQPLEKRKIKPVEMKRLARLQKVRPAWWCGDSRFIQQFKEADLETDITERQAWFIRVLWYKYRKQLGHNGPKPEGYRSNSD